MGSSKEIEIKFRIADIGGLSQRLRAAGFRRVTPPTHEMNTLYDVRGLKLRMRGELLRLRKYGDSWLLTHKMKGTVGKHKSRVETETRLSDGPKMEAILHALGFTPTFVYEKFRAEWSDGRGHVVVDETPIGNFGEIEGAPRWIDATARALGIGPADYITEAYTGMFFAWKRTTRSPARDMTFKAVGTKRPSPLRRRRA
jgi:adenylate cyclase class 2